MGEVLGLVWEVRGGIECGFALLGWEMKILWLSGLKSYGYCGIMEEI